MIHSKERKGGESIIYSSKGEKWDSYIIGSVCVSEWVCVRERERVSERERELFESTE